jgi:putative MATE family efflux protein
MSEIKRNGHGAMDMTQGSPTRLIVLFSLPLLAGNVLQQLYNMVDSVVVGNYVGSSALTAVGAGFSIMFLISSLFLGFSMGATIMIAQYVGAGDQGAVGRTVDTIYSALLVIIVPLTLLGVLASGPLLTLIRVPQEAYEQARTYCMVVLGGIVGTLGYNMNSGIMRGLGDSRTPLIFLFIACVINIVLDLVFVLVFSWGVFGVALATILAQICSWVFGIFYINRKYPFLHIRLFRMRLDRRLLGQVIRLGIPSAIQECQFAVGILIMQALINGFGNDFAAGFTAANKIDTFAFMPIESFSIAATTYVGQNMGAGRLDRVQTGTRRALVLGTLVCLAMSAVVLPLRRPLLMLFNREPGVVAAGEAYLLRALSLMFILAMMFIMNGVLRGAGGQRPAEHGREVVSPALLHKARLRIEWPHAVELVRVLLREGVAPALHGLHVDHHRALELPGPGQHVDQPVQVVAVDGPQVGEAHVLKQGAAGPQGLFQGRLDLVVEPVQRVLHGVLSEQAPVPLLEMVVGGLGADLAQMAVHRPHVGVDGHAVVVEKDDQGLAGGTGVVEALIGQSSGQGAVPDQRQNTVIQVL